MPWKVFLNVFIDHDAAHKYAEKVLLGFVCVERRSTGKLVSFFRKDSTKKYHCGNILFLSSFKLTVKHGAEIFLLLLIVLFTSVPNMCLLQL
jgi:hypothetical protein